MRMCLKVPMELKQRKRKLPGAGKRKVNTKNRDADVPDAVAGFKEKNQWKISQRTISQLGRQGSKKLVAFFSGTLSGLKVTPNSLPLQ